MRKRLHVCCLLLCSLVFAGGVQAQEFALEASVLGSAGGTAEAGAFTLTSTIGQSSPTGRAEGETYVLFSGYPSPFFGTVTLLITHTPPSAAQPLGEAVTVTARIEARRAPIESVMLQYWSGGAASFTEVPMQCTDEGVCQAEIPAAGVGATGVAYRIVASLEEDAVRVPGIGAYSFPVHLDAGGLTSDRSLPAGATTSAYRLISVPLRPEEANPSAVLGDDIPTLASAAAYDNTKARFFEPQGQTVSEFPRTNPMRPGRAFWLIVHDGLDGFDTGPGNVLVLDGPERIELEAGWNFVASPFNFPVPVENIRLESGGEVQLRSYTGSYNAVTDPVTVMQPFTGYALFTEGDNTLFVDPGIPAASSTAEMHPATAQTAQPDGKLAWGLRIIARSGSARDADNVAGVAAGASRAKDALDWREPPTPFSALSVHFLHPEWNGSAEAYSSDVRGTLSEGAVWTVEVTAKEEATLTVTGVTNAPTRFEVWLADPQRKITKNLRHVSRYTLAPTGTSGRRLRLIVGTATFVQKRLGAMDLLPEAYTLSAPFPNPATGRVKLRLGLPEATRVTAEVYDVLGRRIATLLDGKRLAAGYHRLRWNAHAASGMYLVRIRAEDFTATRKVVIVR